MTDGLGQVRRWLQGSVLGLDLCPFAAPVVRDGSLRLILSRSANRQAQLQDFLVELDTLQASSEADIATTLLVFGDGPRDFAEFLELVDDAQALLEAAGLEGVVQLAHFHPDYLFAGEDEADPSHYTNRSPMPIIHLLRESLLGRAIDAYPAPESIPARNVATMRALGIEQLRRLWRDFGES